MATDTSYADGRARHLTPADYKTTPWRNGGGRTTEIAVSPEGASLSDGFDWRLSVAEVEHDGPFSSFPGYDRSLTLLTGGGILLDAGDEGDLELREPYKPVTFPGEWKVEGRLIGPGIRDFNLIFARDRAAGRVGFVKVGAASLNIESGAPTLLLYLAKGGPLEVAWAEGAGEATLQAEDTLLLEAGAGHALQLTAAEGGAQVAVVEISPKG